MNIPKTEWETHKVNISYPQAKRMLALLNEYRESQKITVGDVIGLNQLAEQLEEIIKETESESNQ